MVEKKNGEEQMVEKKNGKEQMVEGQGRNNGKPKGNDVEGAEEERLRLYLRGIVSKTRPFPRAEQPMQDSSPGTRSRIW